MGKHHTAEKRVEHGATPVVPALLAVPLADRMAPTSPALTFEASLNTAETVRNNGYATMLMTSIGKSTTSVDAFLPSDSFVRNPSEGVGTLGHATGGVIVGPNHPPLPAVVVVKNIVAESVDCLVRFKDNMLAAMETAKDAASNPLDLAWDIGSGAIDGVESEAKGLISAAKSIPEIAGAIKDIVGDIMDGELDFEDLTDGLGDLVGEMLENMACDYADRMGEAAKNPKAVGEELGRVEAEILMRIGATAISGVGGAAMTGGKILGATEKIGDLLKKKVNAARQRRKEGKPKAEEKPKSEEKPKQEDGGNKKADNRPDDGNKAEGSSGGLCKNCPTSKKPVNPILGIKVLFGPDELDFELPAPLPLAWQRFYSSDDARVGLLGQGWVLPGGFELEVRGKKLVLIDGQGRRITFSALAPGMEAWSSYEQLGLRRGGHDPLIAPHRAYRVLPEALLADERAYVVRTLDGSLLVFEPPRTKRPGGRLTPWPCTRIVDRNGYAIHRHHDERGLLIAQQDSAGRLYRFVFQTVAPIHRHDDGQRLGGIVLAHDPARDGDLTDKDRQTRLTAPIAELAKHLPADRWLVRYDYRDGDLVRVTNRAGVVSREYGYDNHLLVAHRDAGGLLCQYRYDRQEPAGRVVWENIGGNEARFVYEQGRTTYIDGLNRKTIYHFSGRPRSPKQRWIGITHADGTREQFAYDAFGQLVGITDPLGRRTEYRLDPEGRVAAVVSTDGGTTQISYAACGEPGEITDAAGNARRMAYDERGNLLEETDEAGNRTRYFYDNPELPDRPTLIQDARGGVKVLVWNRAGQMIAYTDCSNRQTRFDYDPVSGALIRVTDALGQSRQHEVDALGRIAAIRHADGAVEHFGYDDAGRLVAHQDALGRNTQYQLDAFGRPLTRTDALGHRLAYAWDEAGRLVSLTNENGAQTGFRYDLRDRLYEETGFDGKLTRYHHNAAGELIEKLEAPDTPDAVRTVFDRDAAGRLTRKTSSTGRDTCLTEYAYDPLGQLILARNQDSRLEYGYDPRGLLRFERRIALGRDETLLHELDALGNRIATRLPDGRTVNWLHYGSGHLHQINLDGEVVCDLERDALHREITRTQGALHSRYRLDAEGRLLLQQTEQHGPDKTAPVQGGLVIERRYAYDRAGQLQSIGDRRRGQLRYRYDALGRLTEALHGDGQRERFAFDPAHNLIEPNGAALPDNRLTVFEDKRYRYDERGNLLEKKIGAREVQRFRWDPDNQLVEARTSRHVGEKQQERVTRYAYDPLGRRIAKLDGQGKPKQVFLWDGNRLLMEAKSDTNARAEHSRLYLYEPESFAPMALVDAVTRLGAEADAGPSTKNVLSLTLPTDATTDEDDFAAELKRSKAMLNRPSKEQLAQTKALGEATQQLTPAEREGKAPQPKPTAQRILYYHCDHLGTPQELTDRQGNIVWAADYAAWGKVRKIERPGPKPRGGPAASGGFGGLGAAGLGHSSAGRFPTHGNAALQPVFDEDAAANEAVFAEPIEQHLRFQGQYFDAETGLHYNRFRYYDPECGRFVSLDPIGLAGGVNSYQYVPTPTGWIDALGLTQTKCSCGCGSEGINPVTGKPRGTLQRLAQQVREAGKGPAVTRRTIAVGMDESGALHAGSSNGFDAGQRAMADELGIKRVPTSKGKHAEENLMKCVDGLKSVGTSKRDPCGPSEHDCAGQLNKAGIDVDNG